MDGVYAGIAGAYSCEINLLHHFYALKLQIQVEFQSSGSEWRLSWLFETRCEYLPVRSAAASLPQAVSKSH